MRWSSGMRGRVGALASWLLAVACAAERPAAVERPPPPADVEIVAAQPRPAAASEATDPDPHVEALAVPSEQLSAFWGEPMQVRAMVVTPPGHDPARDEALPVVLHVHGFGGDHRKAQARAWPWMEPGLRDGTVPRMIYVFLDASFRTGHHVFADSANNGPWGAALTEEFLPVLERRYGAAGHREARFLTGHSSGGWSTLWLQVAYPEVFGGTWPTAPDPVDFRSFTGVDLYAWDNVYRDPKGEPVQLVRGPGDTWRASFEAFTRREVEQRPVGGQMYSFDAVFSPRRDDGTPAPMFDRQTGAIDHDVVEAWKAYDIARILRTRWTTLGPALAGRLHVVVGTRDTFRLDEACRLLDQTLQQLGSPDRVLLVEGRDHGDLSEPHPEHYPDGLQLRIYREMRAQYDRAAKAAAP